MSAKFASTLLIALICSTSAVSVDAANADGSVAQAVDQVGKPAKIVFTADEVREDLRELVDKLRSRWSYIEEKQQQTKHSLDDLLAKYTSLVKPSMVRDDVIKLLRQFVASLDDGHCSIYLPTTNPRNPFPFRMVDTVDGAVISETADGGEDLKLGDIVLDIDGYAIEDLITEEASTCSVSNEATRRVHGIAQIEVTHTDKRSVAVTVERYGHKQSINCTTAPKQIIWKQSLSAIQRATHPEAWITSKLITPTIGYLQIKSWMPVQAPATETKQTWGDLDRKCFAQMDQALEPIKNASDIVLDLRGNSGGRDQLCSYLAGYFIPERPVKPYALRYRAVPRADGSMPLGSAADGFYNQKLEPAEYATADKPLPNKSVWILVDGMCFSATDTFLDLLTDRLPPDRIHTIGRQSQGGIGGPTKVGNLHHTGAALTVSTCKAYDLHGRLLEGRPARIDVPIQWTSADVASKRDPDLERALHLIQQNQTLLPKTYK